MSDETSNDVPVQPEPLDLSLLAHFPFSERRSLVGAEVLQAPPPVGADFPGAASIMKDAEAAEAMERLADRIVASRRAGRPVVVGMGAHAVKLGLGAHVADLIDRGVVTAVAMNGACAYHDMELAVFGGTSEDVATELPAGRFGFADEPSRLCNDAAGEAAGAGRGLGEALARAVAERVPEERARFSVLATAARKGVALTVHVAIGTDVAHAHPSADGAALGAATFVDFRRFLSVVRELEGGVYVNLGSAVLMPEVFLKAVSVAVHLGGDLSGMTTANLDMLDHYRPRVNVVERPPGEGIDVRARHEESVPALRACVVARMA
ncbi:MAG: GSU2086 family protein [Planctomycetota bacterium]|jgi:hypothetical protein